MRIFESLRHIILENVLLQQLKDKYVGEGKPVSDEVFSQIEQVCKNKFYLIQWLTKKVGTMVIKSEDIYKFEEYFDLFEKHKNKFKYKDINQYKTQEDVADFIRTCIEVREKNIQFQEVPQSENYVSQNDIDKLESSGGAKFIGMYEGYQVFRIYKSDESTWKIYRDILGRCKGRDKGAKIEICTISNYRYFKSYLEDYNKSNYFVLYNLDDPKSPYQLHIESGQFMDKNDDEEIKFNKTKFYDWISQKVSEYPKSKITRKLKKIGQFIPVRNKGWEDEKGKQGWWAQYNSSNILSVKAEFKDDEFDGLYLDYSFFNSNELLQKITYRNGEKNGPYESYDDGKVEEKGTFENGRKVGEWFNYNSGVDKNLTVITNYDFSPIKKSYIRKGKLEKEVFGGSESKKLIINYYPNGKIKSKGNITSQGKSGKWEFYDEKGKLFAVGHFSRGAKSGKWVINWTEEVKRGDKVTKKDVVYKVLNPTRGATTLEKYTPDGKLVSKGYAYGDKKWEDYFYHKIWTAGIF